MGSPDKEEVLAAVLKLLTVDKFQDVCFVCCDGRKVRSNRAFLAARCDYFEKLLYGGLCEAGCTEIRLQAPSPAVEHILHHLHSGSFSSIEQEVCWGTIMETCALAQQYMLPDIVKHTASRVLTDLQQHDLGLALSFALKHDLQPVLKNIWCMGNRLLQHPLRLNSTFTADAVGFCLQHTAWLATSPCAGTNSNRTSTADRLSSVGSALSLDGRDSGNGTSNGRQSCTSPSSHTIHIIGSSAASEAAAYTAVLAWMQAQVDSCKDCAHTRCCTRHATCSGLAHHSVISGISDSPMVQQALQSQPVDPLPQPGCDVSSSGTGSGQSISSSALHPGGWAAPGRQSPFGVIQSPNSPVKRPVSAAGTEALAAGGGSDSDTDSLISLSDSMDTPHRAASSAPAAGATQEAAVMMAAAAYDNSSSSGGGFSGHCCEAHEAVLLQLLARINWHLLEPSALDVLESLAFLQPLSLLSIYRAHQRCSHLALHGSFNNLSLAGQAKGFRCCTAGAEQVLECHSISHLTAIANMSFTRGKHCWQFVITVPCDLIWLGVGTDSLVPDIWGGKQSCGWFYGSNDALCHHRHSDRHAYEQHCGFGKWGEGAVVDVYLDMDEREVWFSVDGAEAKLGFTGLPERVYPAVSLRAPAELMVRFRAASWLMAQQQQEQQQA